MALRTLDVEIAKFPQALQDKLYFTAGPQFRSSFVVLKEQQEKQQGKIATLEEKIQGMTSNATESQKRIGGEFRDDLGMKNKIKIEKDLATLVENQKTAMPSIGDGVGYFVF